jgi:hypothetical protein
MKSRNRKGALDGVVLGFERAHDDVGGGEPELGEVPKTGREVDEGDVEVVIGAVHGGRKTLVGAQDASLGDAVLQVEPGGNEGDAVAVGSGQPHGTIASVAILRSRR